MIHKPLFLDKPEKKTKGDQQPQKRQRKTETQDEEEDAENEEEEGNNEEIELDGDGSYQKSTSKVVDSTKELSEVERIRASTYNLIEELSKFDAHEVIARELAKYDNDDDINLLARKINWDLKEEIAPKLEKLKKRTQKAIVEILREKYMSDNKDSVVNS